MRVAVLGMLPTEEACSSIRNVPSVQAARVCTRPGREAHAKDGASIRKPTGKLTAALEAGTRCAAQAGAGGQMRDAGAYNK